MITEETIVSAIEDQVYSVLDDESVILDLDGGIYYGLDMVGTRIWEIIQNPTQVNEVINSIEQEYEVDRERCTKDILNLLEDLEEHNLLTVQNSEK